MFSHQSGAKNGRRKRGEENEEKFFIISNKYCGKHRSLLWFMERDSFVALSHCIYYQYYSQS